MSYAPVSSPVDATAGSQEPSPVGDDPRIGLLRVGKAIVVLVYVVVLVNLVLLGVGFFLQLFGASTEAEFTQWVYRNVDRTMDPFRGIFPSHQLSDQSVLDVSLLFAMVVYATIGLALHALIAWLTTKIATLRRRRLAVSADGQPGGPTPPPVGPPAAPSRRPESYGVSG